jgi:hypothetical protein
MYLNLVFLQIYLEIQTLHVFSANRVKAVTHTKDNNFLGTEGVCIKNYSSEPHLALMHI